ncbi:MAG: hypothetical protein LBI01_06320 [Elusimicrobium sp.]|nr:hypothetical protein [Elusimicrobium sp.]
MIFVENHIYFMTNFIWAGLRPPQVFPAHGCPPALRYGVAKASIINSVLFRSLRSLGCMLKNFFGFWTIFNFSGPRRTLRLKYLLRPEKIENHLKIL